jgi:hypothetical protein
MNWLHLGLVLALAAGTSGTAAVVARSPVATLTLPAKTRHTGFDCVLPIEDRWISCSRFPHLEASI